MNKLMIIVDVQEDFLVTDEAMAISNKIKNNWDKIKNNFAVICLADCHDPKTYNHFEESKKYPLHAIEDNPHSIFSDKANILKKNTFSYNWYKTFNHIDIFYSEIHLCGLLTDVCVLNNAIVLRNMFPKTKIVVHEKFCAGSTVEMHEAALKILENSAIDIDRGESL